MGKRADKGIVIFTLAVMFYILLMHESIAATYYVDSSSGSDSNAGTARDKAFKTLDYAISKLQGGDKLYLLNGIYYSPNEFGIYSKTLSSRITISSYPGHKATIKNNIPKFENPSSGTWTKSSDTSLNIWSTSYDAPNREFIAQYDDSRVSLFTYTSNTEFRNSKNPEGIYYDTSGKRLYVRFDDSTKNPNSIGLIISNKLNFNMYGIKGAGITIANLSFSGGTRCINVDESENIIIEGNTCEGAFLGISVKTSKNVDINKNKLIMKRGAFSYKTMKGSLYETSGIFLQDGYDGIKVSNNRISGHFNGILTYATSTGKFNNIEVNNNVITDIYDDAIEIEDYCNGGKYHHNNITDAFVGVSLSPVNAAQKTCLLYNNVIIANKDVKWEAGSSTYNAGECFKLIGSMATQKMNITKNTCVGRGIYSLEADTYTQKNMVWKENIFYTKNEKIILKSGLSSEGVVYDYNLYFRQDGGEMFQYWNSDTVSTIFSSLDAAKSSSLWNGKWDVHSKQADPLFQDIGKFDVRLKDTSPACKMSQTGGYIGAIPCKTSGTSTSAESHWLEAEVPSSSSSVFTIRTDSYASNGQYLYASNSSSSGEAVFEVNLRSDGQYILWGRIMAADTSSDSFLIKVNSGNESLWDLAISSGWVWQKVSHRDGPNPVIYNLKAGTNKIYVKYRESGAKIDKLLITSDSKYTPSGKGEDAENIVMCGNNVCDESETCDSCSSDCGQCPVTDITSCKLSERIWREDKVLSNAYDLSTCFTDPLGETLTYSYSGNSKIKVSISSKGVVTLTPDANWYGTEYVTFTAKSGSRSASTNKAKLTVTSEPDCGDNVCELGEDCNSCSSDCGACQIDSGSSSGGGGGGGGSSSPAIPGDDENENETQGLNISITDSNSTLNFVADPGKDGEGVDPYLGQNVATDSILTANAIKTDSPDRKNINPMPLLLLLLLSASVYSYFRFNIGDMVLSRIASRKDKHIVSDWKNYFSEYENRGFSIDEIKQNLVEEHKYDRNFVELLVDVYKEESVGHVENKAKNEWHTYFSTCLKKGFSLEQIKQYLISERGYDRPIIESLIGEFQARYYSNGRLGLL